MAWLGSVRSIASLVLDPPQGLLKQSYAPRRQTRGLINADGWGVGFYVDELDEPVRWRSARPLWSDASFASVSQVLRSTSVLAAVRSATPGMPSDETAAAPFTDGRWLLSHNGRVDRTVLPARNDIESVCDSAVLAAHVFDRGVARIADTVATVAHRDPAAVLNMLLIDGTRTVGVTWGDSLSYIVEPDGVAVASEPWDDDPRWIDVPDRHLIEVTPDGVTLTNLEN